MLSHLHEIQAVMLTFVFKNKYIFHSGSGIGKVAKTPDRSFHGTCFLPKSGNSCSFVVPGKRLEMCHCAVLKAQRLCQAGQLWADVILSHQSWPTDLDRVMLQDQVCMKGMQSHRKKLYSNSYIHVFSNTINKLISIKQKFMEVQDIKIHGYWPP